MVSESTREQPADAYDATTHAPECMCENVCASLKRPAVMAERDRIVSWCRDAASNNASFGGASSLVGVKALTDRDARMFAFIADSIERGDHLKSST